MLKVVPLLADDRVADQVAGVHCEALQLTGSPGADFFNQIVDVKPQEHRGFEGHSDVHPCHAVPIGHRSGDCNVASVTGSASEAADFGGGGRGRANHTAKTPVSSRLIILELLISSNLPPKIRGSYLWFTTAYRPAAVL